MAFLSNQLSRASLSEDEVTLTFQDFGLRDKGQTVKLKCRRNEDFLPEAKRLIFQVGPEDTKEVFFCFYQNGVQGRTQFNDAYAYWASDPISCIYFWIGEKPESPVEKMAKLERCLNETRNELSRKILRLEANK